MAQVDTNLNFINRISDLQEQLSRCKDLLVAVWHQELDGVLQPKIKLQIRMVKEKVDEIEEILQEGVISDK